jgi:pimeloyl-ACP methyl ester carboxylesterase
MEEVLDHLGVHRFSVLAHSAGAPYALSFANRLADRVQGEICLLAPWVGGGENCTSLFPISWDSSHINNVPAGYKWLKYVPNGILKTAQAAEWKLQAWMIGKPPKVAFRGIGFDVNAPITSSPSMVSSVSEGAPRPSIGSGGFSDYDDLQDFDGRFDSRSTLGRPSISSRTKSTPLVPGKAGKPTPQGPPPSGFFSRFRKSSTSSKTQGSSSKDQQAGSRLRGLRSVGSFKGRAGSSQSKTPSIASISTSSIPALPSCDLGPEAFAWLATQDGADSVTDLPPSESYANHSLPRSHARQRSVSHSVKTASLPSLPSTLSPISAPSASLPPSSPVSPISPFAASSAHQAALANALIAASHAEAARGVHPDLLQILNHSGRPWGFSYATYPHPVRVWYGDRDEKIAEGAVRWMERTMGPSLGPGRGGCSVKVVRGADHALMYNSMVVIEALEQIRESWR